MDTTTLTTGAGVTITRTASTFDPAVLEQMAVLVDRRRGGVAGHFLNLLSSSVGETPDTGGACLM